MKIQKKVSFLVISFFFICSAPDTVMGALTETGEQDWQDEQIYSILVDRFYNADPSNDFNIDIEDPEAFHGGDIQGIIDRLDELKEQGFTSIRLSPIMANTERGYHGYWVEDFMAVEEHFGTLEDAKRLVEEAHQREMKVIFDFVINNTGPGHPWLEEEDKQDWFHENQEVAGEGQEELENSWISGLPDLNQSNPEVREYLFDAAAFWINETEVDGFRLDSVNHVPKEFLNDFSDHVKSIDPDFFLLGEIWSDDPAYIASYQETGMDAFVNYPFYETASAVFAAPGNSLLPLYELWEYDQELYTSPQLSGLFMDNQDTIRFTRIAAENGHNPITRWKLALTYMYTAPGIPIIYQGSEIPMDGGEVPDNRRMVAFNSGDAELKEHLETLSSIRLEFPALTMGDFELVGSSGAMSVYKRTYQEESVYIAINNDTDTRTVSVTELEADRQLRGLLLDNTVRQQDDGSFKIALERETSEIFIIEENTGINWLFVSFLVLVMGGFVFSVVYLSRKNRLRTEN